jgi:hypothetical protein
VVDCLDELRGGGTAQVEALRRFRLLVLDAPNAPVHMVAVGADGGVVRAVAGAARVVVHDRKVVAACYMEAWRLRKIRREAG